MTLLGGIDAGQESEEGRFSRAVDAHHPQPVTVGDGEGQPLEQDPVGPSCRYLLEIDEYGHEVSRVSARLPTMAFGQQSGPPASARQVRDLLTLLHEAGHTDFRDARGPMGFTQRQAAGKFTGQEAEAFIEELQNAGQADPPVGGTSPVAGQEQRLSPAQRSLRRLPAEQLAAELQRRGWTVTEPRGSPR